LNSIEIAAGVGLILFGIRFLRKGLDRLFGGKLITWLSRLTSRPWKAFGAGIAAGAVSPSSTSISIMAVQLLSAGRLRAEGILAMLLGANVGMTILVQFMAMRIEDYAGLMIALGVAAFLYARREMLRGCGQCLLALGFIFLAIQMILNSEVGGQISEVSH
jgi:phosphate:Na+ symporter